MMENKWGINKKQVVSMTKSLGLICLFIVICTQVFWKQKGFPQELSFTIAILGIIFLSISLNLKNQDWNNNQGNFYKKNASLIFGVAISFILSAFYLLNSYIN